MDNVLDTSVTTNQYINAVEEDNRLTNIILERF